MAFALTIDFPLGYYQGRDSLGEPELYPTLTRLYSALVAAAFEADIPLLPREHLLDSLVWMEGNPPDAVSLPDALPSWTQRALAYRKTGLAQPSKGIGTNADYAESGYASRISSLAGPVIYWWKEAPTEQQIEMLSILADEIAYIGERPSLARVQASSPSSIDTDALPISMNHLLSDSESERMDYPEVGRLQELSEAYARSQSTRPPTDAQDRPKSKEAEQKPLPPRSCVGLARYRLPKYVVGEAPWTRGLLVSTVGFSKGRSPRDEDAAIDPSDYVAWSVALHRSIIRYIGWGAAPMITGKFAEGIPQPANHMAIQVLPAGVSPHGWEASTSPSFAILFPPEAKASEIAAVRSALRAIPSLYRGKSGKLLIGSPQEFDPTRFWSPASPDSEYWWQPIPGAVVEIRGNQAGPSGDPWSIDDALALATSFVWRDRFETEHLKGLPRYQHLVRSVEAAGVRVLDPHKIQLKRSSDYVHRRSVPDVLTVVSGELWLRPLGVTTQLVAIGQSRHLGGGLLVPIRQVGTSQERNEVRP